MYSQKSPLKKTSVLYPVIHFATSNDQKSITPWAKQISCFATNKKGGKQFKKQNKDESNPSGEFPGRWKAKCYGKAIVLAKSFIVLRTKSTLQKLLGLFTYPKDLNHQVCFKNNLLWLASLPPKRRLWSSPHPHTPHTHTPFSANVMIIDEKQRSVMQFNQLILIFSSQPPPTQGIPGS